MTNAWPRTLGTLLMVFAGSTPICSQATGQATRLPNTPAGQQFGQFLTAFNSRDKDTRTKDLEVNCPGRLNRLDEDLRFRQGTGGFDFKKVEDSKPLRLISIVKEKNSDQFARATLDVEDTPAHRVTGFDVRAIPTPPEFEGARGPEGADSPAERQFPRWLRVVNQGDRPALLKFFNDNSPSEVGRIDGDLGFRARTGGFDFRKAVSATATQFTTLVQERGADQLARAGVTCEPNQ